MQKINIQNEITSCVTCGARDEELKTRMIVGIVTKDWTTSRKSFSAIFNLFDKVVCYGVDFCSWVNETT